MSPRNDRPRIIWDLDDTLNSLMAEWLAFWNTSSGSAVSYGELIKNPPHELLGIAKADYLRSLDEFRNSRAGRHLKPNPSVLEWFRKHGHDFDHHVITARPEATVPVAADWVFSHFGQWIRHFHFVPAVRENCHVPDMGEAKAVVIDRIGGGDYFLDDDPLNLETAGSSVGLVLLVPQPWNNGNASVDELLSLIKG
jgi:hypothetical protein